MWYEWYKEFYWSVCGMAQALDISGLLHSIHSTGWTTSQMSGARVFVCKCGRSADKHVSAANELYWGIFWFVDVCSDCQCRLLCRRFKTILLKAAAETMCAPCRRTSLICIIQWFPFYSHTHTHTVQRCTYLCLHICRLVVRMVDWFGLSGINCECGKNMLFCIVAVSLRKVIKRHNWPSDTWYCWQANNSRKRWNYSQDVGFELMCS